ncbi:hypothetical protein ACFSTD_07100 [Novosphingobium colocasiae]
MIKMLFFLKRHPSLSGEEFKALYESRHARLGEKACAHRRPLCPALPRTGARVVHRRSGRTRA